MNKPLILHLRASNFIGGPERQILRYAEAERNGLYDIVVGVLCGKDEGIEFANAIEQSGLSLLRLPAATASGFRSLSSFLRCRNVALICCHGYKADILGVLAGRRQGIPTAAFLRGWTGEDWKVRKYEAFDRRIITRADRIVCLSETQANEAGMAPLRERIHIVTNAIALPNRVLQHSERKLELCAGFGIPPNHTIVASAGRLSPEKGTIYFLHAAKLLHDRFPYTSFIVFGDGRARSRLEQLSLELKLDTSIFFAGHRADFPALLPGVDIFVNPSLAEQSPNVVLEAMASGVPVIATRVGSVAEIGGDGSLICVQPGNSSALADAIAHLLNSPELTSSLRAAGPRRIAAAYSLDVQKAHLRNLYAPFAPAMDHPCPTVQKSLPFISIIVPIRNEAHSIARVLHQLIEQDYPSDRYEILVADGRSTDNTRDIVTQFTRTAAVPVRLIDNPGILSSAGRNVGIKSSRGEVVAFIDGHCTIPSRRLLSDTAEIMLETGAACLARPQPLTNAENGVMQRVIADVRGSRLGHGADSTIFSISRSGFVNPTSSGAVYRREVFDRVGLYDEAFDACEDVEFNFRLHQSGIRAYIDPRLTVFYEPRKTLGGLFRQMARYGKGRFSFQSKHPQARSLPQLVPPGLLLFLAMTVVAAIFLRHVPWIFMLGWACYLLAIFTSALWLALTKGSRYFLLAPPVYWAIHFGLGYGFWVEALSKLRKLVRGSTAPLSKAARS